MHHYSRKSSAVATLAFAGALAASLLGAAPGAQATIFINTGNNPQPGEETIQFGSFQSGTTFTGTTNQTNTGVQFTSNNDLENGGVGQAKLLGPGNTVIPGVPLSRSLYPAAPSGTLSLMRR